MSCPPLYFRVASQNVRNLMELQITPSIADKLPSSVKQGLAKLPPEVQSTFEEEFKRGKKSGAVMLLLAIFFPVHFFVLKRNGLGVLYWFTIAGCGVWYIIEWFMAIPRTTAYNHDLAKRTLRDIKIMHS